MSNWIKWNGGECPVDGNTLIDVTLRNGKEFTGAAESFYWNDSILEIEDQINFYRIVNVKKPEPTPEVKTLRDEFAIAALIGIVSHTGSHGDNKFFAKYCYKLADAMMKERTK